MNMHWVDWLVLVIPLVAMVIISLRTKRYIKGVSDFMAGGRAAGRYMVAVSDGIAALGLITVVALFEFYYKSGFAVAFWSNIQIPIWMFVALTGYIIYRFRETRAMTMAQFFELRYSKRFRVFCGFVAAVSGILNYGIFPAIGGHFFVYYFGLPETVNLFGCAFPTFGLIMLAFLAASLVLVLLGGQLTVMVSDCLQAIFGYIMYVVVTVAVLAIFNWDQISTALLDRAAGESMLNPFDTGKLQDFNIFYVLIGVFGGVYGYMAWQGNQGYNCAAASPHEAKMGRILGTWRAGAVYVMLALLSAAAYTYMHHPDFASGAAVVQANADVIQNEAVKHQMLVPLALAHFLPVGVKGMFAAVMLFLLISTQTTYLHSWGSIVIQDVVLPVRKKAFTPENHLKILRLSIIGVAVFGFFFSLLYRQTTYILMFFALTGAIFLGGAGSVIVGGLYWKKGTTPAAWTSMIVGALMGGGGIVLEQVWPGLVARLLTKYPESQYLLAHQERFPINGQYVWFIAMVAAILAYVVVSLLTCREDFNMDRMLHRGKYARDYNEEDGEPPEKPPRTLQQYLGIDEEFTKGDRIISYFVFGWSMFLFGIWLVISLWNFIPGLRWSDRWWANYFWVMGIIFPLVVGVITTIWFTIGGAIDIRKLFKRLATLERSELDDGRVVDHMNLDDVAHDKAVEAAEEKEPEPASVAEE